MIALVKYDAARHALQLAHRVDEVKDIRDKHQALAAYARQSKDVDLEMWSTDIKERARRRMGEISAELPTSKGGANPKATLPVDGKSKVAVLKAAGISTSEAHRCEKLAAMPEREFEKRTEAKKQRIADRVLGVHSVHYTSDEQEWYTPSHILDAVIATLGAIDLDPCSNSGKPNVKAKEHFTEKQDGLSRPWSGRIYMNPPYGDVIAKWTGKLVSEQQNGNVSAAVALVPARTDTAWFHEMYDFAICFIEGRLRFSDAHTSAPFPSAAIYLGSDIAKFAKAFRELGSIMVKYGR